MKYATCHPDRQHLAKGLCKECYWAARYRDPVAGPIIRKRNTENWEAIKADPELYKHHRANVRAYNAKKRQKDPAFAAAERERLNKLKRQRFERRWSDSDARLCLALLGLRVA